MQPHVKCIELFSERFCYYPWLNHMKENGNFGLRVQKWHLNKLDILLNVELPFSIRYLILGKLPQLSLNIVSYCDCLNFLSYSVFYCGEVFCFFTMHLIYETTFIISRKLKISFIPFLKFVQVHHRVLCWNFLWSICATNVTAAHILTVTYAEF